MQYLVAPGGKLQGSLRVPGDKSISHRAIMLGALATGTSQITGFLEGDDALATLQAFRAMGVTISTPVDGRLVIHGVGLHGLQAPSATLDVGNSGTSMRLLAGLLAGQAFSTTLVGDNSLMQRPMERVAKPLRLMGAAVTTAAAGRPPITIHGGTPLQAIRYELPMASAQVKSCLLLAGLYASGITEVVEPAATRDHTERMLRGFGVAVDVNGPTIRLQGGQRLTACNIDIPADISSAAFFMVAAAISPGADITLQHVGINATRNGIIPILNAMGANISLLNQRTAGTEPVADIRIQYAPLQGITIPTNYVPLAIDEFPALFVAAANASGTTVLTGAAELRVKESDRIQVMADGLQALGVKATPTPDGMIIKGGNYHGGEVNSHGDHRIAMAFTMAALRASSDIRIHNCENVATSFPGFVALAAKAGVGIAVTNGNTNEQV